MFCFFLLYEYIILKHDSVNHDSVKHNDIKVINHRLTVFIIEEHLR